MKDNNGEALSGLSNERLGQIVEESSTETYVFAREDFRFVLVNRGARENLGYSMEELRNLTPWDIKPEIEYEEFLELVAPLIDGKCPVLAFETVHKRKDGTCYPVSVQLQLMQSDGKSLFYAAIRDITERQRTENQLKSVTARLDAILNNTKMSVFLMDDRQHCIFMNRAAEQMTGYSLDETRGRPLHDVIHHTYPDGRPFPLSECAIDRAFPEDNQTIGEEVFVHKDGSFYPVGFTASPLRDETGKPVGTVIEARDISEDLAARRAKDDFNELLTKRIEEALEDRKQIEAQLLQSQKMEAIGQLTGGIAHDFNNLLQVIGGNLQLLERHIGANERARSRLEHALEGVERGAKLASQLLAFGRKQALQPKPTNIGKLVRGLSDMLARALGDAVEVETVVAGGLWNCLVDPLQVESAILNLAINARDAMNGEGKLTIEAGNASLDDRYAAEHNEVQAGQYVMLAVTDTGGGMTPDVLERVFDPFFTTKAPGEGTGLGLSMVYGFVKQSGGHIKVYTEAGHGTTVRIYLPRTKDEELASPLKGARPSVGGSETVLVVEDDDGVRSTAVELLSELGYKVLEASNAENALAVINSGIGIDILFTDVVMPGKLRSTQLARLARERLPRLAVLFTSGYTENAIVHAGRLDEDVDLLSKPYSRQQLADKIRLVLDRQAEVQSPAAGVAVKGSTRSGDVDLSNRRLLVVEDELLIRMVLVEILEELGGTVTEAGSLKEAREAIAKETPQIVITDLGLPDGSAVDLITELRAGFPEVKIVVSSGGDGNALLRDNGLDQEIGVLPKPYDQAMIIDCLRTLL